MPRRVMEGKVVSNKCDKTVTVLVERMLKDAMYGKIIRRTAKFAAHDEKNEWKTGDVVMIEECRPISKSKNWKVISGRKGASGQFVEDDMPRYLMTKKKFRKEANKTDATVAAKKEVAPKKAKVAKAKKETAEE